jgi:hypothetical protein
MEAPITKKKIKEALREFYGEFETFLDKKYEKEIIKNLHGGKRTEWATYNQVLLELKYNIKDALRVKELQYRITDQENPNHVCIDIISKLENISPELERLADKIRNFD